jgi:hypothetical protein
MNGKQILAALGIASTLLAAGPATGCASTGAGAPPAAKPDTAAKEMKTEVKTGELTPEVVTVTTKDYSFTVHTPAGWTGDTETAKKYQGAVYFSQQAEASPGGAKILVTVYPKLDENLGLRLQGDIQGSLKQFPKLELGDLDAKHPRYATFQKVLSMPGNFYQYVSYLNPGTLYGYAFSVEMSKKKVPATPEELAAYKDIVQSLAMAPPSAKSGS